MSAESRTLRYIATTAATVSERIQRDLETGQETDSARLAEDVAWLARQVARLAEMIESPEPY